MQRTLVAIAFALAMTCAFTGVVPTNYVKAPVQVVPDADTNFTNNTKPNGATTITFASATFGDLYVIAQWRNTTAQNASAYLWAAWFKKLNIKELATSQNTSIEFQGPNDVFYYNNYIVGFGVDNDTGVPALRAYQQPLTGGAALPRLTLSSNTNASWFPSPVGIAPVGKTFYIFYLAATKKVNLTNFVVGGAVGSNEYTVLTTYDDNLEVIWGEALSTGQVFASWMENGALKDSVIELSKGTVTPNAVGGWNSNLTCELYTTDKKWYGELCMIADKNASTYIYSIRTNTTSLAPFMTTSINKTKIGVYPYGPYLAIFYRDSRTSDLTTYSYDIWNLDTYAAQKNNTQFLTNDGKSAVQFARINAGGIYTLTYTLRTANTTISAISVGLVLGSSYLASILGFLFTIVAGLFLF